MPVLFLVYFIISSVFGIDSRLSIVVGLGLLALATSVDTLNFVLISANDIAIYAYYFIVTGVILQLINLRRKSERSILGFVRRLEKPSVSSGMGITEKLVQEKAR